MNTAQAQKKALDDAATVSVHKSSIRFTINKKKVSLDVDIDLGHSGDIIYLTDVNVDYLHQPWRAFATVINKCLSVKETGMDKIRLSHAQILWGMFHKKNIGYDQSISRRNKMFWHTARDDTMFTSMRCISRHEDTQVYVTILIKELTNQAMLESKAYHTYYAFASGEKALKPKYIRKKADSDTSPKKKIIQATKGTKLKNSTKVAKSDKKKQPAKMPKAKGLNILSKVALTEAEQIKLATKTSKTQFHISHISGSGDGVDIQSKVHDEQQQKVTGINEGAGVTPEVFDVPKYDSEIEEESWTFIQDDEDVEEESDRNDDSEETKSDNNGDDLTHPNLSTYKADEEEEEEEKLDDEEDKEGEQEEEEDDDLYRDLNINLKRSDAKMTDAQAYQDTVSALESEMSKFRQTSQFAEAVSLILGIVDTYLASKIKEVVDIDSTMKEIIKEHVQSQVSKIMPKIEMYVTESLGAEVLVRSTNQPQTSYVVAALLFPDGGSSFPMTSRSQYHMKQSVKVKELQERCIIKALKLSKQQQYEHVGPEVKDYELKTKVKAYILQEFSFTSLIKQERECKLHDAFDKFTHLKGESLHKYYLRLTQLINDMNIYNMKMEQFQVNTKFLNSLPPEWSKFVTDVKLVKDLHATKFDQLHAYLEQHELHANEVRLLRERD
ncbi:hypothetical protein Tco_0401868 [Tanacetum coccineum]